MATARSHVATCRIVKDRILELESIAGRTPPDYNGVLLMDDTLLVIDSNECNLQIFKIITTSPRLNSNPYDVCLISKTKVAVCLWDGTIVILQMKSMDDVKLIQTVMTGFYECYTLSKLNSEKLVVSGCKDWRLCWGIVSIADGRLDSIHDICEGDWTNIVVKDSTVYISCCTDNSITKGVYAFDIFNPDTHKYLYQHQELERPGSITADRDCLYVCDWYSNKIHQLTDSGQLVTIYRVSSSPLAILYNDQYGLLYTTSWGSNEITVYKMESLHQPGVPIEIMKMDDRSIQLFEEALKDGKETMHNIRIMVVGHMGVGKTTLVKRLLGEEVNISERHSTEGIDVYVNCCDVSLSTQEWTRRTKDSKQEYTLQRLVKVLNENCQMGGREVDLELDASSDQRVTTDDNPLRPVAENDKTTELQYRRYQHQNIGQHISSTSILQNESSSTVVQRGLTSSAANTMPGLDHEENVATEKYKMDPLRAMIKVLQENPYKAKRDISKHAQLTILDFAGQYAFYTTHQLFMSRRAIYLLVSDASRKVSDLVEDECYFDSQGTLQCKVHDLLHVWMNSIHSCAASDKENLNYARSHTSSLNVLPPPVILVGTHIDQISQNLPKMADNNGGQMMMLGLSGSNNDGPRSTLQEDIHPQRKRPSMFRNFVSQIRRIVSSGGNTPDPRKSLKYDIQAQQNLPTRDDNYRGQIVMPGFSGISDPGPRCPIVEDVEAQRNYRREHGHRYLNEIRSYLKDKPTAVHLVDEDFAIDNSVLDSKLEELKKKIVEVASQQPYWGEQIPTRWFLLEQQLMSLRDAGVKVVPHSTVVNLNKEGTVRLEESEELDLFLRYLHETGTIIYFSIEVLRDNILLDPKWMIDALKLLINAQPSLSANTSNNNSESNNPVASVAHSDVTNKWSDFKEKGILTVELVDDIWTKEKHPDLHEHKDHILMIMEQLNILTRPRSFNEMGEKMEDYFLTPCMLRQEYPKEVISPEEDPCMVRTPDMCCIFTGKYLPTPIFHRLLAACVARWPVAKKKETSEYLIFCGCCVFDLDLFHRLTVYIKNHVVFARIMRMVVDEVKTPDAKLCSRVRRFITLNLSKITSYLGQNLQYELQASFQTWHADEAHDQDAPLTPDHMNYARLCVALITVCGNALRRILLTNFPVPYADIYQVILANRQKLTVRPGRPLLNNDQIMLIFPDPLGNRLGTLDQFDISLLYILIRNVSTVPAPVTGWSKDPCDQPRDTSLGASVERIRSFRNHISGHSADGKISRQGLEDYWDKFEAVIHDVEVELGEQVCIQELEKQRTQVISIFEAC